MADKTAPLLVTRDALRAELEAVDAGLVAAITEWRTRCAANPYLKDIPPECVQDSTGRLVLGDFLVARAQVLAALASLDKPGAA